MTKDRFSEISGEKFKKFDKSQEGNRVLLFRYWYRSKPLTGLWLSDELSKKRIEAAHYVPDLACEHALQESGALSQPAGLVWLGLFVKYRSNECEPAANLVMPEFMVTDFTHLAISPEKQNLVTELEERFHVAITIADKTVT